MAAPTTTDDYLDIVRKSGVVDPERLESSLAEMRASNYLPDEPKKAAGALVRRGVLTMFHAEQFLRGVYKGFEIGKYTILERIGVGGMGTVYLGQHKVLGNRVAIKVLPSSLAKHQWFLNRFYKEAQAIAALDHPNIVHAHDVDSDGRLHFLVMEFVDGANLQEIVGKHGPFSFLRAAHYMHQAAQGLQNLHEVGVVHRDVKPGNIMLDQLGIVKILDLGLARFLRDTRREVFNGQKNQRALLGTDDYLAPEQIVNSDDVDIRADIYSLGATFYFCLTGSSPFESEERAYHKLIKHLAQRPKSVRELKPEIPAELEEVVVKMMAKNPWQRHQTPQAVLAALEPWVATPIPPPPETDLSPLPPALKPNGALQDTSVSGTGSAVRGASHFEIGAPGAPPTAGRVLEGDRWVKVAPTPPPASADVPGCPADRPAIPRSGGR
jgi:serine/threonine protein kinase